MNVFNNNKGRRLYFAAYFIAVKIYNFYLFLQNLYDVSGQNFYCAAVRRRTAYIYEFFNYLCFRLLRARSFRPRL